MRLPASVALLITGLFTATAMTANGTEKRKLQPTDADEGRKLIGSLSTAKPAQKYMIPLKESEFVKTFRIINSNDVMETDPIMSITSIAASIRGTVLWFDEWEDGYEVDVTAPSQASTKIWGDGDWANGCIEMIRQNMAGNMAYVCSSADEDIIKNGESFILQNSVPVGVNRVLSEYFYDGGDIIKASFPVALTRAGYPDNAAAGVMGGSVEMLESKDWGKDFISPVGTDVNTIQDAFTMVELWLMAAEDNTVVSMNGVVQATLNRGEEMTLRDVQTNDIVTASRSIQANLITGEKNSHYEMRWYSLRPTNQWSNDYYTPVHMTVSNKRHRVLLYNPGPGTITVEHYNADTLNGGRMMVDTFTIPERSNTFSNDLAWYTGSQFKTSDPAKVFQGLTITDFDLGTQGQQHDWGHPLIPAKKLTSQALVGLGHGCVNNDCGSFTARSLIWITPTVDSSIYIDFDGDGTADPPYNPFNVKELEGITVTDDSDNDMTGAIIWATKEGTLNDINDVYIAVAWGQDPLLATGDTEAYSLDMGTIVVPLPEIAAAKTVAHAPGGDRDDDGHFSQGDILRYTIRVTNTGRVDIPAAAIEIVDENDPLFEQTDYVAGSTRYTFEDETETLVAVNINDNSDPATAFPLDEVGLESQAILYVGAAHQVTFDVEIKDIHGLTADIIINVGHMKHNGIIKDTFETETRLKFVPSIDIQTTVYPESGGGSCPGVETYTGLENTPITYCYVITNTGNTYLDLMTFSDDLGSDMSSQLSNQLIGPGDSITLTSPDMLMMDETNIGNIAANPSFVNGVDIATLETVNDSDPAVVIISLTSTPTLAYTNAPTFSPSGSPVSEALTDFPTQMPTGGTPVTGDICKTFDTMATEAFEITQFSFLSRTNECVRASVYVSNVPMTSDELSSCCTGVLGSQWILICEGYVMGMGNSEHTYIDEGDCTPYTVEANTTQYFHVSMELVDEATFCLSPDISSSRFSVVKTVRQTQNVQCGLP